MDLFIVTYKFYNSDEIYKSYVNANSDDDAKRTIYHSFDVNPIILKTHQLTEEYVR